MSFFFVHQQICKVCIDTDTPHGNAKTHERYIFCASIFLWFTLKYERRHLIHFREQSAATFRRSISDPMIRLHFFFVFDKHVFSCFTEVRMCRSIPSVILTAVLSMDLSQQSVFFVFTCYFSSLGFDLPEDLVASRSPTTAQWLRVGHFHSFYTAMENATQSQISFFQNLPMSKQQQI